MDPVRAQPQGHAEGGYEAINTRGAPGSGELLAETAVRLLLSAHRGYPRRWGRSHTRGAPAPLTGPLSRARSDRLLLSSYFAPWVVLCVWVCLLPAAVAAEATCGTARHLRPSFCGSPRRGFPRHRARHRSGRRTPFFSEEAPFTMRIEGGTTEPPSSSSKEQDAHRFGARPRRRRRRFETGQSLVSPGDTGRRVEFVPLRITEDPVSPSPRQHESPETAVPVNAPPDPDCRACASAANRLPN